MLCHEANEFLYFFLSEVQFQTVLGSRYNRAYVGRPGSRRLHGLVDQTSEREFFGLAGLVLAGVKAIEHLHVKAYLDAHALLGFDAGSFLLGFYLKFRELSQRLDNGQYLTNLRGLVLLGGLLWALKLHAAADLRGVLHLAHREVNVRGDLPALAVDAAHGLRDHCLVGHGL